METFLQALSVPFIGGLFLLIYNYMCIRNSTRSTKDTVNMLDVFISQMKQRHGVVIVCTSHLPLSFEIRNTLPNNNYLVTYDAFFCMFFVEPVAGKPVDLILINDAANVLGIINRAIKAN